MSPPTARPEKPDDWSRYFRSRGHLDARPLAAGAEGTVYRLGDGLVAKVWHQRPRFDLPALHEVQRDLARAGLDLATPTVLRVEEHRGRLVTYERELPGSALRPDSAVTAPPAGVPERESRALLAVLRALASVPATPAMRRLTVRGDDRPLWRGHDRFPDALAALVRRSAHRLTPPPGPGPTPRGAPEDTEDTEDARTVGTAEAAEAAASTAEALERLPDRPVTLVHGDLVPPNIHVDRDGHPVAVLDFGLLTTAGDPAFDAAVSAATWDMYGPHARRHRAELTALCADELGYDHGVLELYQRAYTLVTHDLFGTDDRDGHFRWCAALLRDAR
ncbi:phosphotransferase [Streptomyces sp. NPDC005438]|uniref:phosphotransferase family protein n=1 Tax=Streptomyces sp. NPDC005438 TaxID=3156880 RepID=UPI0033A861DE